MTTHWLEQAGRHPLLTESEALHLGALVRRWQDWEPSPDQAPSAVRRRGLRARVGVFETHEQAVYERGVAHLSNEPKRLCPNRGLLAREAQIDGGQHLGAPRLQLSFGTVAAARHEQRSEAEASGKPLSRRGKHGPLSRPSSR